MHLAGRYNSCMASPSTYDRIHAVVDSLLVATAEKQQMNEHRQLVTMIEARRHLLVGAKALTAYMEQRFTKDTDYVVGRRDFARIRKWFKEQGSGGPLCGAARAGPRADR
ncbi:MAG: hypothetical protein AMXMBFR13_11340 [Phycisphaerae bacterium]